MHPNRIFHVDDKDRVLEFSQSQGFGMLVINADPFPLSAHIPFLIDANENRVEFHLAKNNPMRALLDQGVNAKLCVMGPHAYISADWYGIEDQVPTWNYIASEICGKAKSQNETWLADHLRRLSAHFEGQLDKAPWSPDVMKPSAQAKMQKGIFGVSMHIDQSMGTWKLGQNKPAEARAQMIEHLKKQGHVYATEIATAAENT